MLCIFSPVWWTLCLTHPSYGRTKQAKKKWPSAQGFLSDFSFKRRNFQGLAPKTTRLLVAWPHQLFAICSSRSQAYLTGCLCNSFQSKRTSVPVGPDWCPGPAVLDGLWPATKVSVTWGLGKGQAVISAPWAVLQRQQELCGASWEHEVSNHSRNSFQRDKWAPLQKAGMLLMRGMAGWGFFVGERLLRGSGGGIEWESLAHSSKGGHFHGNSRVTSLGHKGRQC